MEQRNGYFRITWKEQLAVCHLFAPKAEGVPVSYKELASFLDDHGISGYRERELAEAIAMGSDCVVPAGSGDGLEFAETMHMHCSLDKMKITATFYPPSQGGASLNEQDILAYLKGMGIRFGICQENIADFLANPIYCTQIVVAEGKQPRHGHDAKIEYFFNINPSLKPKHNEDGSVDYHALNTICAVEKGDKLATLHPVDEGEPGMDVFGKALPPRPVKNKVLEYGRNISISEDGLHLFSDVTGHVSLTGGKVFVSDVYEVQADVDTSTGDINYAGSVHIHGSVRGGFVVTSRGDIVVDGSVEDAMLQAGGDIIVQCGIQGMQRGLLEAKGNVITKYIENAKVFAGGYVETGSIIYSEVSAGEDVIVAEKKGFINGGVIRAGGKVEANSIGSSMGAHTVIEVGMPPEKKERFNQLQKDIAEDKKTLEKYRPVMEKYVAYVKTGQPLDAKHKIYFTQILATVNEAKRQLEANQTEYEALQREMMTGTHAKVVVKKDIYPGTQISISDASCVMQEKRSFCCLERKNGEIVINNM